MTEGHFQSKDKKIPFKILDNWKEISIEKFLELNNPDLKDSEWLSILSDIDMEVIRQCSPHSINGLIHQLRNLLNFEELLKAKDQIEYLEVEKKKYYLLKDLGIENYGLWEDMKQEVKMYEQDYARLPYILTILCRLKGEAYDCDVSEERAEKFKQVSIWDAFSIANFFLSREIKSKKDISPFTKRRKVSRSTSKKERSSKKRRA